MEEQGKRLLLAVVLAFAIMMGWSYLFPPETPETPPEGDRTGEPREDDGDQAEEAEEAAEPREREGRQPAARRDGERRAPRAVGEEDDARAGAERGPEQRFTFEFERFHAEFTSHGGALASWELQGDKYRDEEGGQSQQIDIVKTGDDERLLPFRIGFDGLELIPEESEWEGERKSDTEIEFTWSYVVDSSETGEPIELFDIVKTYRIHPDDYLLELAVGVENKNADDEKLALVVSLFGFQDPNAETGGGWFASVDSSWKAGCLVGDELELIPVGELSGVPTQRSGEVRWTGLSHSYFLLAAAPEGDLDAAFGCRLSTVSSRPGAMRADLVFPSFKLGAGDPRMTRSVLAYLGPKYLDRFETIARARPTDPGFGESIDFGWFGILSRPLLWLLQAFYSLAGNWGLAIIFLTIVVKLATLYWTTKSMRSMKKMARLRPKIEALQKKYKDDRQRQQAEMMNLYKAHGVNPMAGCLPMLLQMPIWFALYRMLMAAAELYHTPFIPGWVDDLTAADPLYILPIVLVVMMFMQAKLSPTTADSTQQKIMMYGLPLSFGVFSFFLPSGLTLYILTNTILTTLHQFWMNRTDPHTTSADAGKDKASEDEVGGGEKGSKTRTSPSKANEDEVGGEKGSKSGASSSSGKAGSGGGSGGKGSSKGRGRSGKGGGKKQGGKSRRR